MNPMRRIMACAVALVMLLTGCGLAEGILTLPSSLRTIDVRAFYGDRAIQKVVLPNNVREIRQQAFANSSLSEINLPDSITSIDDTAFDGPEKVRVTANEGSYAYRWAVEHGYITPASQYPESEHPYGNNVEQDWSYTHPTSAVSLRVTFSEDTEFEQEYDTLIVTDSVRSVTYTGRQLAGQTLQINGSSFTLHLHTDNSETRYGFRITNIEASDQPPYPESMHPYDNDMDEDWTYTHPTATRYLSVTFSDDTQFENQYDTLAITDSEGTTTYTGSDLAGRTLCIVGRSFTMHMHTDESVTRYGFRIVNIVACSTTPVTGITVDPTKVDLRAGETHTLTATVTPATANQNVTWSTSNRAVATVSNRGVVTAVADGSAIITATSAENSAVKAQCKVRVGNGYPESDHPYENDCDEDWTYEHATNTPYLGVTFSEDTAFEDGYDILTVTDSVGSTNYTGTELAGRTIFTSGRSFSLHLHTDYSETRYGFRITAIQAVSTIPVLGVTIDPPTLMMKPRNTQTLTAVIEPSNATNPNVTWSSSNRSVATVSSSGVVTAVAVGTATITATSAADNTKQATCTVTVANNFCSALLIGQMHFNGQASDLLFTEMDVALINSILQARHGSNGYSWQVNRKYDRTKSQVRSDIQAAMGSATDSDISLFYLSTHGVTNLGPSEPYASAVLCYGGDLIKTSELAQWLGEVKGKVIVMIDSCGSGGFIYANGAKALQDQKKFTQDIVDAFAAADPGVYVPVEVDDGKGGKVGELRRENKFYVLTASAFQQSSWGGSEGSYFTMLVRDGVGTSGSMPADTSHAGNSNNQLTLHELYKYISDIGDNTQFGDGETQQVQVFPTNSSFVMFKP